MRNWGLGGALMLWMLAAGAGTADAQAALLFGYRPHAGQESRFHEGYRQHLEWHRANQDSLIWYGWQVVTGTRPGVFIDGTFGRPFLAFDRRVNPAGDAADFNASAAPYADALFRVAYALREDLSTGTPLEEGRPTPLLEVIAYRVRPGGAERFTAVARRARDVAAARSRMPQLTWYEVVNGARQETFVLLVHRDGFAGWDSARADLSSLIRGIDDADERASVALMLTDVVTSASSEVWRYLPASSLIPGEERPAGR